MPSWCQNEVTVVSTSEKEIDKFVDFVKDGDNHFSLNKIIPIPDELVGTRVPTQIISQEEYDNFELSKTDIEFDIGVPITKEMSHRFKRAHGYDNWYDWSVDNWGTKWDVNCQSTQKDSSSQVKYYFDSAWCPPEGIYHYLQDMFPDIEIAWFYKVEDLGKEGWLNRE